MRRHILCALLVGLALSTTASATMVRQQWNTGVNGSRPAIVAFLGDLVNPDPVPDVDVVIDNAFFLGAGRDNYVAKFYGWVTVPETGTYQFHYWCDDYGMLYVSQDEEMANAVEVAYVDGWTTSREWNKYASQHSESMDLAAGQELAIMAFYQEAGGDDWMGIGWTGPGLSNDPTNPTELTDYITHIPPTPTKAKNPQPESETTDVPIDVALSWTPGRYAATHNVYLGSNFDDVNDATAGSPLLVSPGQAETTYDPPGLLEYGTTYYWRIDEVNAPPTSSTVFKGKVWNFTTEPRYYAVEDVNVTASLPAVEGSGPLEATVNGAGLTDGKHGTGDLTMWSAEGVAGETPWIQFDFDRVYKLYGIHVWNYNGLYEFILGFGLKDITIEYATEPNEWVTLGDYQLNRAPNKATYAGQVIDLDGLAAQSIRINVNSTQSGGSQVGLSEIQFLYKPVFAREPEPADGATDIDREPSLSWRVGREAVSHQVHLGTDANAVAAGEALVGTATTNTYDAGALNLGTTYYWMVGEVNDAESPGVWDSTVWNFGVQPFVTIDGFETYTGDEGSLVYEAWVDGFGIDENGSQVGHNDPPYVERTIRKSGSQSMPMSYSNTGAAASSEAEFTLAPAMDWTAWGVKSLSLAFAGTPDSDGQLYVKINGTKVPYDGPASDLSSTVWHAWNIDLSTVGNVKAVNKLVIGVEGAGATGLLYFDNVHLYPDVPQYITPEQPSDANLVAHYTFDEGSGTTVGDSSGNGNHGTTQGSPAWVAAGKIGGAMEFSGDDYVDCGDGASLVIRDAITVACWIKVDAFVNDWEAIIAMGDDSYRMSRGPATGNGIHWGVNGPTGGDLNGAPVVTTNTWRHIALVYDGAYRYVYIDGVEAARLASTGQIDESNYNLWIGANEQQSGRFFHGLIDDVRIYSRPLSPAEVAGLASRTEPLGVEF
ncbi:MAG: discoidin domain-containing protein [Sedimentisphaerales bacterium]|nr:discoidin domain-containing protein [Sedimentisphaerales bacterium]